MLMRQSPSILNDDEPLLHIYMQQKPNHLHKCNFPGKLNMMAQVSNDYSQISQTL